MKVTMMMVKVFLMISALALTAVSAGGDESAEAAGRRLVMASATAAAGNGQIKSMDSWLRWLLMRSRPSDKEKIKSLSGPMLLQQLNGKVSLKGSSTEDLGSSDEFDDDIQLFENRQASKRQPDDYGHMRYGKRDFDDYGHMRFGR